MSFQLKIYLTELSVSGSGSGSNLQNLFFPSSSCIQEGEGEGAKGETFSFCLHQEMFPDRNNAAVGSFYNGFRGACSDAELPCCLCRSPGGAGHAGYQHRSPWGTQALSLCIPLQLLWGGQPEASSLDTAACAPALLLRADAGVHRDGEGSHGEMQGSENGHCEVLRSFL